MVREFIICSAIWYDDGKPRVHNPKNTPTGIVIAGRRHHNCFRHLAEMFKEREYLNHSVQGFLTSTDHFVTREEAYIIAKREGQLYAGIIHDDQPYLTSEELY